MKKFFPFILLFITISTEAQIVTASGNMSVARWNHVAINMGNNKVIAIGGDDGAATGVTYSSAEIWTNGAWKLTGSMHVPRTNFAAVMLNNGMILAIGGQTVDLNGYYANCELYNPSTGTWSYTDSLLTGARSNHAAVVLNNGNVLVVGGDANDTCELYNASTNTWSRTGVLLSDHGENPTVVLLKSGKVLAVGGSNCATCGEVYDPSTGLWTATSNSTIYSRDGAAGLLLNNGEVLISGSTAFDFDGQTTSELYNPTTNSFDTTTGRLLTNVGECPSVLLDDGFALVWCLGDFFLSDGYTDFLQAFNPSTSKWFSVDPSASLGTQVNTATKLSNNQVLIAGGSYTTLNGAANNSWLINGNLISTTGVTDISINNFAVFPNPGNNFIQLQLRNPADVSHATIEDLQGRCLKEVVGYYYDISVKELPAGMYIIRLYNHDQQMTGVQKWIKQ